ncbi:MAG TPA: cytochrome c peroxidase [Candidatus Angelobacter sp.]|nr:cytochrome c peroxidase [Candidatus Angelobacter sp.]
MKPSSGTTRAFVRIFAWVVAIVVALGYYGRVRAQSGGDGDSGTLPEQGMVIPLRPLAALSSVPVPPVFGMEGILADKTAAIELGKALFWDMQAGSDDVQACASCHFNAGADSRVNNEVNPGADGTFQMGPTVNGVQGPNHHYVAGTAGAGFGGYHDGDFPFHKVSNPDDRFSVVSDVNDVSASQGSFPLTMGKVIVGQVGTNGQIQTGGTNTLQNFSGAAGPLVGPTGDSEALAGGLNQRFSSPITHLSASAGSQVGTAPGDISSVEQDNLINDPIFSYPDPADPSKRIETRRTGGRNAPSVVNAVFNYRNFWDGRAQNVCNGLDPFGARNNNSGLLVIDGSGKLGPAHVAMQNSALCSQSLGPILSNAEMSADGRDLRQVGKKLLARVPLAKQMVDPTDSVLGPMSNAPKPGLNTSYAALIQKAFLPEWWQFASHICLASDGSTSAADPAKGQSCPANTSDYTQMEYNFSLFWSVAIQEYESTLIADQTPFDKYMEQQKTYNLVGDGHTQSFTVQLDPGVTPYTVSVIALDPLMDFTDQDMAYAFDYGDGRIMGVGLDDGEIDYSTGKLTLLFGMPPTTTFPVKISYSTGPTPLTTGQLRGLLRFQTTGRCVNCHGGPELSNASVGTVSTVGPSERMIMADMQVRVYDTGFYHIGVRPTSEDAGLGGTDPDSNAPLSESEYLRERVCKDPSQTIQIPGRPGDGISIAPLSCGDMTARNGFFKAPQLRNVGLTAPYFHDGSQLTLEQVVEFYNRGGDFNLFGPEHQFMDADIDMIGLTMQDKIDLVDFLRNALTDPRTANQSAPFDHPQLFTPNGAVHGPGGYPVENDPDHPGRAKDNFLEIPATGANGGKPQPTFLQNLLGVQSAIPN